MQGDRTREPQRETYLNMARLLKMGDFLHASRAAHGSRYKGPGIWMMSLILGQRVDRQLTATDTTG